MKHFNPFILGTVQLGQPYGIANNCGKPNQLEADAIVRTAWEGGIKFFDTAQVYGDSESVLGKALLSYGWSGMANVITKLPPKLPDSPAGLRASIKQSLKNLGIRKLYCLMLHRQEQLTELDAWPGEIIEEFQLLGFMERIGVSVYTPEAALTALAHRLISVVQFPASLFDRRFESAGVFAEARRYGKELHIRSIFLQGVLSMRPEQLPDKLFRLVPALQALQQICTRYACSQLQGALSWILHRYPSNRILFGVERASQVRQNLDFATRSAHLPQGLYLELESILPPQIPELLNPALWTR